MSSSEDLDDGDDGRNLIQLFDWRDHIPSDAEDYDYDSDSVQMNGKSNSAGGGNADVDPYSGKHLDYIVDII